MKNFSGEKIFSLEYDKETLRDMVIAKQEEIEKLKLELSGYRQAILQDKEMLGLKQENERLQEELDKTRLSELDKEYRIDKAIEQCKQDIKDIWKWEGAYTEMFEEIIDILKGSE